MSQWRVTYRTEEELQQLAAQFRERFGIADTETVLPIEGIVDVKLGIDIVPLPGLYRIIGTWGALSADCTTISVDEVCCSSGYEEKYRFTLAHEVAHRELHADIYKQLRFSSFTEFKEALRGHLTDAEHRSMEWQADFFAGCALVPEQQLRDEFQSDLEGIEDMLAEWRGGEVPQQTVYELALGQICEEAGGVFGVSPVTIDTRLHYTGLKGELARRLFGRDNSVRADVHYRDLPD